MKQTIEQLQNIISAFTPQLFQVDEEKLILKTRPEKWSKKEILGHLIDSAQNNIRRFVVAQYEDLPKIVYKQDDWVRIADYQNYPAKDLIELWLLLNKHICIILTNISTDASQKKCDTNDREPNSIEWLAADYNKHLLHHLHQVLDLEPVAYP
jgi:DinB superfamily